MASNIQAERTKQAFRLEYTVTANINAKAQKIWDTLTNISDYPKWNSTIISVEGKIAVGEKITLRAKIAEKRVFTLKVSELEPLKKMVWESGTAPMFKGVRTYTLTPKDDGSTDFTMAEKFAGLMLPMIAGSLPDFRPAFEQFALDLKQRSEKN